MAEAFVTLAEAAELEGGKYKTMAQRYINALIDRDMVRKSGK